MGVRGVWTPEPESPVTHKEPHEETFAGLPELHLLRGLSCVHVYLKDAEMQSCEHTCEINSSLNVG